MTIAEGLERIVTAKESIRQAIESQGVECDTSVAFGEYGDKIRAIPKGSDTDEVYRALMRKNYLGIDAMECVERMDARTVQTMTVHPLVAGSDIVVVGEPYYAVKMETGGRETTEEVGGDGRAVFTGVDFKAGDEFTFTYLNYLKEPMRTETVTAHELCDIIFVSSDPKKMFSQSLSYYGRIRSWYEGYVLYYANTTNPTEEDWILMSGQDYSRVVAFYAMKIVAPRGAAFPQKDISQWIPSLKTGIYNPNLPSVVPDEPAARYEVTF